MSAMLWCSGKYNITIAHAKLLCCSETYHLGLLKFQYSSNFFFAGFQYSNFTSYPRGSPPRQLDVLRQREALVGLNQQDPPPTGSQRNNLHF